MLQWHQCIFCRFDRDRKTLLIFSIMIDINHLNMQLPRYTINQNTARWTECHYLISPISASTESARGRFFPHWLQSWFQNKKWSPIWSHLWECCWFEVWEWWSLWVLQQKGNVNLWSQTEKCTGGRSKWRNSGWRWKCCALFYIFLYLKFL